MEARGSLPEDYFEKDIHRARENFRTIAELKEKLEMLTEHVDSRKEALEEEIEEKLHEAIKNGRDCLEKIQENIDPKLEKVIRAKLEEIDKKMKAWKEDNAAAVREEIQKETPDLTGKILGELDPLIVEKVRWIKKELLEAVQGEADQRVQSALKEYKEAAERKMDQVRTLGFAALGLSVLVLVAGLIWMVSQ